MLAAPPALARQADGTLGLIITPNSGRPALVLAGGEFEAVLTEKARLRLRSGDETVALETTWRDLAGGRVRATCRIPVGLDPGAYELEAVSDSGSDRSGRAVYVYDAFDESYTVAHVTDSHIGAAGNPARTLTRIFARLNEAEVDLVLITGDLTEKGRADEFKRFLDVLGTCDAPTFVSPGEHDRKGHGYESFFGPATYAFRFGPDGYLGFDTSATPPIPDFVEEVALLQRLRRQIKAARWTMGFTHRYETHMGMRSQLVLFVDNPLDFLAVGHLHRELEPGEELIPWKRTKAFPTPAAIDGAYRIVEVREEGPVPAETQRVAND